LYDDLVFVRPSFLFLFQNLINALGCLRSPIEPRPKRPYSPVAPPSVFSNDIWLGGGVAHVYTHAYGGDGSTLLFHSTFLQVSTSHFPFYLLVFYLTQVHTLWGSVSRRHQLCSRTERSVLSCNGTCPLCVAIEPLRSGTNTSSFLPRTSKTDMGDNRQRIKLTVTVLQYVRSSVS
jgi:hypothetical protein